MKEMLKTSKNALKSLSRLSASEKSEILFQIAQNIEDKIAQIIIENEIDLKEATSNNVSEAMKQRLYLDEQSIKDIAQNIRDIAKLDEPIGKVLDGWTTKDGLEIEKITTPIGLILAIYESRPNVTADIASLCLKSSNGCILKGGKEASHSNKAIYEIIKEVLSMHSIGGAVSLIEDNSHEVVEQLLREDKYIDLVIPRGGRKLIDFVSQMARMPVIKHDKGLCHIFVDESADAQDAISIIINAKTQRPAVCNAVETVLVHESISHSFLPLLLQSMNVVGVEIKGCDRSTQIIDIAQASEEDFHTEYLAKTMSLKIVKDVDAAIEHVGIYSSKHSDAILTNSYKNSQKFLQEVDSSCVYVNASTRFTDGTCFGFGAEVGISTNKIHARGPMGINELTSYKFIVRGNGQIRK